MRDHRVGGETYGSLLSGLLYNLQGAGLLLMPVCSLLGSAQNKRAEQAQMARGSTRDA